MGFGSRGGSNGLAGYLERESPADHGAPASSRALTTQGVLVAALVVAVLVLVAVSAFGWHRSGSQGAQANADTPNGVAPFLAAAVPSAGPDSPSPAAATGPLAACRVLLSAESATIGTAVDALAQWRVHVAAMNQLVAGQITLAQANAFWSSTRTGATKRVAGFEQADQRFRSAFPDNRCSGQLPARCQQAANARGATLAAAQTAVATWKHHVMDMEMLRMGDLSPAQATANWLHSWKAGVAQLHEFHDARQVSSRTHC
jgi:hypothetical protein